MEVVIPTTRSPDFDFNSAISSPCSTPRAFGEFYSYLSAPTSPSRMSELYKDFEEFTSEMKSINTSEDEFAFDFSVEAEDASCPAEELFDGGKIKPLKPPPGLQIFKEDAELLKNPRSRRKHAGNERERGRGRSAAVGSSSSRRETRSLSPYRVSAFPWEDEQEKQQHNTTKQPSLNSKDSFSSSNSKSSRRWRLRDLLLFRSASEGHASSKENMKKYSLFFRKQQHHEDVKSGSSRSNESSGSAKGSSRKGPISAHELYYNANKAAQKDLKKKTSLPYKQGIWGRLPFGHGFGSYSH